MHSVTLTSRVRRVAVASAVVLAVSAGAASAHISIVPNQGTAGSTQRMDFRIPHGCDGQATVQVVLRVPASVTSAKPMLKPGWAITLTQVPTGAVDAAGKPVTRVSEISWLGGPLPDNFFDDFSVLVGLPADTGPLAFPIVQKCTVGERAWVDPVVTGQPEPANPNPVFTVLPKPGATAAVTTTTAAPATTQAPATTSPPATTAAPTTVKVTSPSKSVTTKKSTTKTTRKR